MFEKLKRMLKTIVNISQLNINRQTEINISAFTTISRQQYYTISICLYCRNYIVNLFIVLNRYILQL